MRRQDFGTIFDHHFLTTLFSGLDDMPPAFATQAPAIFDNHLPNLSRSGQLRRRASRGMSLWLTAKRFRSRFGYAEGEHTGHRVADRAAGPEESAGILQSRFRHLRQFGAQQSDRFEDRVSEARPLARVSVHTIELKGQSSNNRFCREMESETDTEEFEKVSQTPSESQNNADNAVESEVKVQAVEFGTCTDEIETKNSETMTEVCTNQFLVVSQSLHKISYLMSVCP